MSSDKKIKNQLRANRALKGLLREAHFQSGGDLTSWRGRHDVCVDRKKRANKRSCRGKVKWD